MPRVTSCIVAGYQDLSSRIGTLLGYECNSSMHEARPWCIAP